MHQGVTKGSTTLKILARYAKSTCTMTWYRALEQEFRIKLRVRGPTTRDFAAAFPSEHELKLLIWDPGHHALKGSMLCWRRIRDGMIATINAELAARVDSLHGDIAWIRTHPIWQLLATPLMPEKKLSQTIDQLKPRLNGQLFHESDCCLGIQYKSLYLDSVPYLALERIDELALRLVLFRLSKITSIDSQWPIDIPGIVLLTLRITAFQPFKPVGDRMMKLVEAYLQVNGEKVPGNAEVFAILDFPDEQIYRYLMNRLTPAGKTLAADIKKYEQFRLSQQRAIQTYWDWRFKKSRNVIPTKRFGEETLHLADRVYQRWLFEDSQTTISNLFLNGPPQTQPGRPKVW